MFLLIAITAIIILLIIPIVRLLSVYNHWKKKGVKYVEPLPILGNMLPTFSKSLPNLVQDLYNAFPNERFIGMYQFMTPVFFVRDPDLIKSITIKNFDSFIDHVGFLSAEVDPLWGKNLFASQGERWRNLRQTLSPIFTSSKMRTMFILMEECVKQFIRYFEDFNQDVVDVDLKDVFTRYTTDVIATTAFGIECDSLKNRDNEFLSAGKDLANLTGLKKFKFLLYGNSPSLAKLLKIKIVSDRVGNFFRSVIDETIALRQEKSIIRPDLIHSLMLARKEKLKYEDVLNLPEAGFVSVQESVVDKSSENALFLSNEDITAQAVVFFLGGFDTTSTTMCFAAYELAVNPDIQTRLKNEIVNTSRECDGKVTYEKLLNMKYLDMVVSETLRKWPQAVWIDRKCTKDFTIEAEKPGEPTVQLNVGDNIWIPIWAIHHDPKYYPNPDVFDPERFCDANKDKIQSCTFIPFGTGPRNCIGSRFALLETKILLFYLLRNFDIVATSKTQVPLRIKKDSAFLLPEKGFHVGFKRNQCI